MIEDAKTALAAAVTNENAAQAASEKAGQAVRAAQAARDSLIGDAAAGKAVKAQDVRAAEEAARAAEIDAEIAARVHSTAITLREHAQIASWDSEAAELQSEALAAADARIAAATVVDEAFSALRRAIDGHKAAGARLRAAQIAASVFNSNRDVRRVNNAALRARIAIEGPNDPVVRGFPTNAPYDLLAAVYVGANAEARTYIDNVATFDSRHLGRPLTQTTA